MTPYYEDSKSGITVWHGDCREILPTVGKVDLVLADPPYGIGADNQKRILSRGKLAKAKDYGATDWDSSPPPPWLFGMLRDMSLEQIIWGGNYFDLPPSSCWLVWDKLNGENDFADCELAWTNLPKAVRRIAHQWNGMIRKGNEPRFHPTQKPLEVITWAIQQASAPETILDPFAGSGTTAVAAKALGIKCTCIEREERYCEIICKRLSQEYLPLNQPTQKPAEQMTL
jgi:DNA modification methylase